MNNDLMIGNVVLSCLAGLITVRALNDMGCTKMDTLRFLGEIANNDSDEEVIKMLSDLYDNLAPFCGWVYAFEEVMHLAVSICEPSKFTTMMNAA